METLIAYLPFIACGAMMLLICIPMMRSTHKDHSEGASSSEVAELRDEIERLKADRARADERETVDG